MKTFAMNTFRASHAICSRGRASRCLFARCATLLLATAALSAVAQVQAVDALRQKLTSGSTEVTLALPSLRLVKFIPYSELRVENGIAKPGPFSTSLGIDHVAQAGAPLQVQKVELSSDKKVDVLHITLADSTGYKARVGIVLARGTGSTINEATLEQALLPVIAISTTGIGAASQGVVTAPPAPPPPPRAPVHSSDKVDFPPAGEGFPAMHADNPAPNGCWYEPYHSDTLRVEFLYVQCAAGKGTEQHVGDGASGPQGITPDGPVSTFFTIREKHADETLQAAVKRLVVAKFADPAARLACRVEKDASEPAGTRADIVATGLYAKRKSYSQSRNGMPCDGYLSDEDGRTFFEIFPDEDATRFIEVNVGKAAIDFPVESIHLRGANNSEGKDTAHTRNTTPTHAPVAKSIPVMHDLWTAQGQTAGRDLAPEASTLVSFTHGMIMGTVTDDAIAALACEGGRGVAPHLMMHVLVKTFPGVSEAPLNPAAQVEFGKSRHDATLTGALDPQWLTVNFAVSPADVQAMDTQKGLFRTSIGVMFFKGQRIIVTGDLPPANEALDNVLHACGVQTSPRPSPVVTPNLTPEQVRSLTFGKLTLGSSAEDVKRALGASSRFLPATNPNSPRIAYLLAASPATGDQYGLTFIDGALKAYTWKHDFPASAQPLGANLIRSTTEKTWTPMTGGYLAGTTWATDGSYVPISLQDEASHARCGVIHSSGLPVPSEISKRSGINNGYVVDLTDPGTPCGVTMQMTVYPSKADPTIASSFLVEVVDYGAVHSLVSGIAQQQEQQQDKNRTKADQVQSPF